MKSTADPVSIDLDDTIERVLEQAFLKALDRVIQQKAEEIFAKALSDGSAFGKKLENEIQDVLKRFLEQGICWEKNKPGFYP